jgi:hypothetical protein
MFYGSTQIDFDTRHGDAAHDKHESWEHKVIMGTKQ